MENLSLYILLELLKMSKINLATLTFNEGHRLRSFLSVASLWADRIFIVDKSSTDDTLVIAKEFGCEIINIPFSEQGGESSVKIFNLIKEKLNFDDQWLITLTPGEIPSKQLIEEIKNIVSNPELDSIDVIYIPIKLFSFGKLREWGYWKQSSQARLLNIRIALVQDVVHNHIIGTNKSRIIHDDGNKFIIHPTHSDFSSFIKTHHDYALNETFGVEIHDRVKTSHQLAEKFDFDFFNNEVDDDLRPYYAWKIYCYMVALQTLDTVKKDKTKTELTSFLNDFRFSEWGLD